MIDKSERFHNICQLIIDDKCHFILHALGRPTKPLAILRLANELNSQDDYIAFYLNVEAGQLCEFV